MARYLVAREREVQITRRTSYEAEIEIPDDEDEAYALAQAKRLRDQNWRETWEDDSPDHPSYSYEVIERLDGPEPVKGKPEDFGLEQEAMFA